MTPAEAEVYGVDYQTFEERIPLASFLESRNVTEESQAEAGNLSEDLLAELENAEAPPLEHLNTVKVDPPSAPLTAEQSAALLAYIGGYGLLNGETMPAHSLLWDHALFYVRQVVGGF